MKYTIEGLQQSELLRLGLDAIDAVILRYIIDFWHTSKMRKTNYQGKEYIWINYSTIIENLPIIGITCKKVLYRRFQKYIDCGLMEHYTLKKGGTFSYYRFTELYDNLIYNAGVSCSPTTIQKKVKPKENAINKEAEEVLNYLNLKAGRSFKPLNGSIKHIRARLKEGNVVDELKGVVDLKTREWQGTKWGEYLRPSTLFNSEKFPGYLECVKKEKEIENEEKIKMDIDNKIRFRKFITQEKDDKMREMLLPCRQEFSLLRATKAQVDKKEYDKKYNEISEKFNSIADSVESQYKDKIEKINNEINKLRSKGNASDFKV